MSAPETHRTIEAVWRMESPWLIAALARMTRDVGAAEDLAQDALVVALEQWPASGVPNNPGAWLMATAKRRAIDQLRAGQRHEEKHAQLGRELDERTFAGDEARDEALDDPIGDDLLRLVFTACHPVLSPEARVALTLKLLGGLSTAEIARAFLAREEAIAQRIVREKKALADAQVPYEVPRGRAAGAAPVGARGDLPRVQRGLRRDRGRRLDAARAVRGRAAIGSRARGAAPGRGRGARAGGVDGAPGVAHRGAHGARRRADPPARPGSGSLGPAADRARACGARAGRGARAECGAVALQAAIAACHACPEAGRDRLAAHRRALRGADEAAPSPGGINRAVAVGMAFGPQASLVLVDALVDEPVLAYYYLLPSVRGDLLAKLGRNDEARAEFARAASLTRNARERALLLERAQGGKA
jgi:RNA polymerase sigma factor (sigma-70 family)